MCCGFKTFSTSSSAFCWTITFVFVDPFGAGFRWTIHPHFLIFSHTVYFVLPIHSIDLDPL